MGKSLVIVESPAKAKTINKYLGNDFIVKSSIGHIRDLPPSGTAKSKTIDAKARALAAAYTRKLPPEEKAAHKLKKAKEQQIARMGINPDKNWEAQYEILPGKEKVVLELQKLADSCDFIYLATDLDREGEAIAWHLREALGNDDSKYRRVVFNEITKKAIQEAFKSPSTIDISRVQSQQARRFLDRVVGFMISPLLWARVARGLSAGRVQSVAVKLIVEREKEIRAFIPEEFWELFLDLNTADKTTIRFQVIRELGENFRPINEAQTKKAVATLEGLPFVITKRDDRPTKTKPSPPFITSTLQQAASTRMGFSLKKTMMLAQRLYEAGHITYMRTDSVNLSQDALDGARDYIKKTFGDQYIPEEPIRYSSKAGAQEAHEAIRPSIPSLTNLDGTDVDPDAIRLYDLIWRRFMACQMTNAEYTSTTVIIKTGDFELKARGRIMRFAGYTKVIAPISKAEDDDILPDIKEGETLKHKKSDPIQHFTKPSPRFTEASLVKEMEKRGIGRPSTYAAIISTVQERGYVSLQSKRFYAQKMGDIVTERLVESFNTLMDYDFTAQMESSLDDVANNKKNWTELLDEFYKDFQIKLAKAYEDKTGMRANDPIITSIKCPKCELPMQIRTGTTGVFLGCSGYSTQPKDRCRSTINLISGDEIATDDDEAESRLLINKRRCGKCNTAMDSYLVNETTKLHVCGRNPDCEGYEIEKGEYKIKGYEGPVLECDKCGAEMQLKVGRFGKYFDCLSEECKNTRKLLRNGEVAPPKMDIVPCPELKCEKVDDHYLLRDGAAGMFLAASKFPKNREIRTPYIDEIVPHQTEIDPKYSFLFTAPVKDDDGNRVRIKWARKTKEQYIMTEVKGKATGWKGYFVNGAWDIERPKAITK